MARYPRRDFFKMNRKLKTGDVWSDTVRCPDTSDRNLGVFGLGASLGAFINFYVLALDKVRH